MCVFVCDCAERESRSEAQMGVAIVGQVAQRHRARMSRGVRPVYHWTARQRVRPL